MPWFANAIKAETAARLAQAGDAPRVIPDVTDGSPRASTLFEQACDEHARLLARLFSDAS